MQETLRVLTESKQFQIFFIGIILLSGIVVGLDSYPSISTQYGSILHILDNIILFLFVIEILLKLFSFGTRFTSFFKDGWNVFDFIIVGACFLPFDGQSIIVLRLLRVLRVVRLVGTVPELKLIVNTLLKSIPSMGYIGALLSILFYIYACLGTFLFRANDPVHFESLHISLLSLFRVATLEDWTDIMYTAIYGCKQYGYSGVEELCKNPEAFPILGWMYFVSFVLLATFVFLNLIIGVIINNMEDLKEEQKSKINSGLKYSEYSKTNVKDLLNNMKKDINILENHISFLEGMDHKGLKDN
ncbi:MAG: ion transporter [Nitrospinae bacterium]|nr:ion transporter [Nitrospinota bacterium]